MSSEDPSHDERPLVVPFQDGDSVRRRRQALQCGQDYSDCLSSPLREETALSDDEWRQRSVDNILALLKANAELRALAMKLSNILAARGGWDGDSLHEAVRTTAAQSGNRRRS